MEGACILSTTCRQLWKLWHANMHSLGLVPEALRAWWLPGSAFKCGYQGPQILTECQILRSYWCTQPATAPDTSQTEPLNVTDKWIFMKLRENGRERRKNTEWEVGKEMGKKNCFHKADRKAHGISSLKLNQRSLERIEEQAFQMHCATPKCSTFNHFIVYI